MRWRKSSSPPAATCSRCCRFAASSASSSSPSWLHFGAKPYADARVRSISLVIGVMFAGLIYCLFKAIEAIDVPTAVLSYFTYPLLTGLAASLTRSRATALEGRFCARSPRFSAWRLMIGAHPAGLAFAGVAYAIGAACLPDRRAAGHARLSGRRRCAADDLVFDALVNGDIRRGFARHPDLASAAERCRLGLSGRR